MAQTLRSMTGKSAASGEAPDDDVGGEVPGCPWPELAPAGVNGVAGGEAVAAYALYEHDFHNRAHDGRPQQGVSVALPGDEGGNEVSGAHAGGRGNEAWANDLPLLNAFRVLSGGRHGRLHSQLINVSYQERSEQRRSMWLFWIKN